MSGRLDLAMSPVQPLKIKDVGESGIAPLAVQDAGGALRVHTETPHLVSLGGGRLSTAVTLHPLPPGRVILGSGSNVDILVQGTGVDPVHCHIENNNGVVTLHPVSQNITVDGLRVATPTRLAQGVMITIGRSNYMRFNHPAEAKLMKSVLPNMRISMSPIQFSPPMEDTTNSHRKPPVAPPRKSPRESLNNDSSSETPEENSFLSRVFKFEHIASQNLKKSMYQSKEQSYSPKVFTSDLVTVNAPAKDILGKSPTSLYKNLQNSAVNYSENVCHMNEKNQVEQKSRIIDLSKHKAGASVVIYENGCIPKRNSKENSYINVNEMSQSMYTVPVSYQNSNSIQDVTYRNVSGSNPNLVPDSGSQSSKNYNSNMNPDKSILNNCVSSKPLPDNRLMAPSPYYNRNLSYKSSSSTTPSPTSPTQEPTYSFRRKSGSLSELTKTKQPVMGVSGSIEDLTVRRSEAEQKRNQALEERMQEQEAEKAEQARLEEILNMCAEYEKQAQNERVLKPVLTPNRIKTNGSLPRDKRSPAYQITDEPIFKFDVDPTNLNQPTKNTWCTRNNLNSYENVSINKFPSIDTISTQIPSSSRSVNSPYENVVIANQSANMSYHPQSPRTRIKTYVTAHKDNHGPPREKQSVNNYDQHDYDFVEMCDRGSQSKSDDRNINFTYSSSNSIPFHSNNSGTNAKNLSECFMNENLIHEVSNLKSTLNHKAHNNFTNIDSDRNAKSKKVNENVEQIKEFTVHKQVAKTEEWDKNYFPEVFVDQKTSEEKNKTINMLLSERNEVQLLIMNMKKKIADIEIQEEELLRELELEKSLLSGEHQSEMNVLKKLEQGRISLQDRARQMEKEMEDNRMHQERQQRETRNKLQNAQEAVCQLEKDVLSLDKNSAKYSEMSEKLLSAQEALETERKCFEDLEFHHLEEEANMLATREELQREIQDLSHKIEQKKSQILDLDNQKKTTFDYSNHEMKRLERQLISYLRNLKDFRNRLKVLNCELESVSGQKMIDNFSDNELLTDDDSSDAVDFHHKSRKEPNNIFFNNKLQPTNQDIKKHQIDSSSDRNNYDHVTQDQKNIFNKASSSSQNNATSSQLYQNKERSNLSDKNSSDVMSQSFHGISFSDNTNTSQSNIPDIMSLSFHESLLNNKKSHDTGNLNKDSKYPSQDDIDRISKVTSNAPIDMGENTGSLGRKTIESLKEIERNRQLHLVQQGSQVIEEERKRVSELKRRVQDEVRAQWEERRQRECNSLNSIGSEESTFTSNDGNGGSTSENVLEGEDPDENKVNNCTKITFNTHQCDDQNKVRNSQVESSGGDSLDDRRPLSESSDLSIDSQLVVKSRPRRSLSSPQQRPLTRYLPIRSDSLDLRKHIESAGHQIDLCQHIYIDSTTCRGYLNKMGSRFHGWNKRWFVFDRQKRTFTYYSDRSERKQRGGAYFQVIEEVYLDHLNSVKSPNPQLTFIVKTHERYYHLMAPTAEAMRIWIDVIFTGAEGYQEFEHGT